MKILDYRVSDIGIGPVNKETQQKDISKRIQCHGTLLTVDSEHLKNYC